MTKRRFSILLAVGLVVALILAAGHGQNADSLRAHVGAFSAWHQDHPVLAALGYFALYVGVTALSLPFAIWMTLGAGAIFGFFTGLVIASFASATGATCAFLLARYLFRDAAEARMGARLTAVRDGLDRDGALYLLSLRLIPVVPFFLVNVAMALTRFPVRRFYWVSQLGMLPAAAVYVNAGRQLSRINSPHDVLSLPLVVSLAALGVVPWILRWIMARVRARAIYRGRVRPLRFDRNLIVIGGGSAGLVSAYVAAAVGAKVTLIEAEKLGGDCLNTGCVPSKALIRSARMAHEMRHADRYGLAPVEPAVPFRAIMARLRDVIRQIEPHDSAERYRGLGVEVLSGRARIVDPWTVEVTAEGAVTVLTTRSIIIATGASPVIPDISGLRDTGYLTTETMWEALGDSDAAPARLTILGGGPIGCELAQAFGRLGSKVTLIEAAAQLLVREDAEVAETAQAALVADGVDVLVGHKAAACGVTDGERWIALDHKGGQTRVAFDRLILAVGRKARVEGFGLEQLGIPAGRVIETNEYLETLYPNIYAAGDVAGPYQFTHVAAHQAWFATVNALFGQVRRFRVNYQVLPAATFIDPEIARVGLNEADAKAAGLRYEVTRYGINNLDRAIVDSAAKGFVKVLTVPGRDKILGVTIVGDHAAELLAEFVLAMKHGLGLGKILATIHIYPTMAEANKYAAGAWRRAHVSGWALQLARRYHDWRRG